METKTFSVLTLGCRVNQYESDCLAEALTSEGLKKVDFGEKCDVAIVNTCTVTAESDRKSRQMIRRAVSSANNIIVTGCYAETGRTAVEAMNNVTYVTGNGKKSAVCKAALSLIKGEKVIPEFPDVSTCPYAPPNGSQSPRV